MRFSYFVFASFLTSLFVFAAHGELPSKELQDAQIQIESDGDDQAIGDLDIPDHAYGCLGVRQCCVDDYNRWHGTSYEAKDCLGNRELSIKIYRDYIDHYATIKRLHRKPTDQDKARIWNGGPNGWKHSNTLSYWQKVQAAM